MTDLSSDWLQGLPVEQLALEMGKVQQAVHGEEPLMGEAPDTNVTLFRGVYVGGTDWNQKAAVKELTGSDEEYIARMMGGSNPTLYLNAVLTYGVEMLGTYDLRYGPPTGTPYRALVAPSVSIPGNITLPTVALQTGFSVGGTVTDTAGSPIINVNINAIDVVTGAGITLSSPSGHSMTPLPRPTSSRAGTVTT